MKRTAVSSSNLASVGYDPESQILEIEFNSGRVYQYFDVPQDEYDGLMNADSHGRYFNQNIRDNYRYTRIR
ncbi:MAG: KTSC domain-containing protein [Ardenticatenaceae bacterium]|nr:KTSC domain-containing protein [Anaerolineales bacterium]MCB8922198.1 KTSC domain-containing protein [Ardenticatenaceae bacterium]